MLHLHPDPARFSEVPNPGQPPGLPLLRRPATWEIAALAALTAVRIWWW